MEGDKMRFEDVLKDMAAHAVEAANQEFLRQHEKHAFAPFEVERSAISEGGHTFRVTVEFEPDPMEALKLAVARN